MPAQAMINYNRPTEFHGASRPLLHVSASNGKVEGIKYLQSQGVDINLAIANGPNQEPTQIHCELARALTRLACSKADHNASQIMNRKRGAEIPLPEGSNKKQKN